MKYNMCGNCDYCDKSRTNDKGQVRCVRIHSYVDAEGDCPDYINLKKTDIYNKVSGVLNNVK